MHHRHALRRSLSRVVMQGTASKRACEWVLFRKCVRVRSLICDQTADDNAAAMKLCKQTAEIAEKV